MYAGHLIYLQEHARPGRSLAGDTVMTNLRMLKSAGEIELLARAAAQADRAVAAGAAACKPGATELEIAEAVSAAFMREGAQKVEFAIIASGPNGAFPHHMTGSRKLEAGDTVIMDIGASLDGYKSDVTRVVQLGQPSAEVRRAYELVRAANQAGRDAVRPGVRAQEVDRATRAPIARAGMGAYFNHRTGHGLGLEVHEPPYIMETGDTVLEPGMVFSVEPGLYFPGRFGIRIEDIVAVTADGCRRLTGSAHELIVVDA
jgi:D-alanyl-D-alanine dipeptidase